MARDLGLNLLSVLLLSALLTWSRSLLNFVKNFTSTKERKKIFLVHIAIKIIGYYFGSHFASRSSGLSGLRGRAKSNFRMNETRRSRTSWRLQTANAQLIRRLIWIYANGSSQIFWRPESILLGAWKWDCKCQDKIERILIGSKFCKLCNFHLPTFNWNGSNVYLNSLATIINWKNHATWNEAYRW